jgi:hypothetical protein
VPTLVRAQTYSGYVWKIPAIRKIEIETLVPLQGTIENALNSPSILAQTVNERFITQRPQDASVAFEPES